MVTKYKFEFLKIISNRILRNPHSARMFQVHVMFQIFVLFFKQTQEIFQINN